MFKKAHILILIIILILALIIVLIPGKTEILNKSESGEFILIKNKKIIGNEKFSIKNKDNFVIASGEGNFRISDDVIFSQKTYLKLNKILDPEYFNLKIDFKGSTQLFECIFKKDKWIYNIQVGEKKTTKSYDRWDNMVFLSNNVIHHLCLILRKYDLTNRKQEFTVVALPPMQIKLEKEGVDFFLKNEKKIKLLKLKLTIMNKIFQDIWINENKQLIKMYIPSQKIEIFLKGYEDIESLK